MLRKEIIVLKNGVLIIQEALRASVNDSLDRIQCLENDVDAAHHRFGKKVKAFIKKCQIDDLVKEASMLAPQNERTTEKAIDQFIVNIKRFKKFTDTLLNPKIVGEFVSEIEAA